MHRRRLRQGGSGVGGKGEDDEKQVIHLHGRFICARPGGSFRRRQQIDGSKGRVLACRRTSGRRHAGARHEGLIRARRAHLERPRWRQGQKRVRGRRSDRAAADRPGRRAPGQRELSLQPADLTPAGKLERCQERDVLCPRRCGRLAPDPARRTGANPRGAQPHAL
jgi:hypothetical protein